MDQSNRYHGAFRPIPDSETQQLDAFRGIAAIGVAIGHANQLIVAPTNAAGNAIFGLIAQGSVMVFFVLSGFLICKSITRNIEQNGGERFGWVKYASDRLWRIYPPLLFAAALMLAVWLVAPLIFPSGTTQYLHPTPDYGRAGINFQWKPVLGSLIFTNGFLYDSPDLNAPLWSLAVEVWYYVVAGLAVALIRKPIVLIGLLALMWIFLRRNAAFTDYAVVWLAGYCLSILHNQGALRLWWVLGGLVLALVATVAGGLMFAVPGFPQFGPPAIKTFNVSIGFAFAFLLGVIFCGLLRLPTWLTAVFQGAARYSYTLYLIHLPIYLVIFGLLEPHIVGNLPASIVAAVGALAIVIGIASEVARLVEDKRLLQRLLGRLRGKQRGVDRQL